MPQGQRKRRNGKQQRCSSKAAAAVAAPAHDEQGRCSRKAARAGTVQRPCSHATPPITCIATAQRQRRTKGDAPRLRHFLVPFLTCGGLCGSSTRDALRGVPFCFGLLLGEQRCRRVRRCRFGGRAASRMRRCSRAESGRGEGGRGDGMGRGISASVARRSSCIASERRDDAATCKSTKRDEIPRKRKRERDREGDGTGGPSKVRCKGSNADGISIIFRRATRTAVLVLCTQSRILRKHPTFWITCSALFSSCALVALSERPKVLTDQAPAMRQGHRTQGGFGSL